MAVPNVYYIVASKVARGIWEPENEIYDEFEEAVHTACAADEAGGIDVRIVQVILDPSHASCALQRVAERIEGRIARELLEEGEDSEIAEGLTEAVEMVNDEARLVDLDGLEGDCPDEAYEDLDEPPTAAVAGKGRETK